MYMFVFKQKTAYGMRISDWSSDVCSSDLASRAGDRPARTRLLIVLAVKETRNIERVLVVGRVLVTRPAADARHALEQCAAELYLGGRRCRRLDLFDDRAAVLARRGYDFVRRRAGREPAAAVVGTLGSIRLGRAVVPGRCRAARVAHGS